MYFKTWTEYVNRLLGALVGLALFLTFLSSIFKNPFEKNIFILTSTSVFLVLVQAWVGSIVVSTNLLPGIITFHVVLALLIICIVIGNIFLAQVMLINMILEHILNLYTTY